MSAGASDSEENSNPEQVQQESGEDEDDDFMVAWNTCSNGNVKDDDFMAAWNEGLSEGEEECEQEEEDEEFSEEQEESEERSDEQEESEELSDEQDLEQDEETSEEASTSISESTGGSTSAGGIEESSDSAREDTSDSAREEISDSVPEGSSAGVHEEMDADDDGVASSPKNVVPLALPGSRDQTTDVGKDRSSKGTTSNTTSEMESDNGVDVIDVSPVSEELSLRLPSLLESGHASPNRVRPGESRASSGGHTWSSPGPTPVATGAAHRLVASTRPCSSKEKGGLGKRMRLSREKPPRHLNPLDPHVYWDRHALDYAVKINEACPFLGWSSAVAYSSPSTTGMSGLLRKGAEPAKLGKVAGERRAPSSAMEEDLLALEMGLTKGTKERIEKAWVAHNQVLADTITRQKDLLRFRGIGTTPSTQELTTRPPGSAPALFAKSHGQELIEKAALVLEKRFGSGKDQTLRPKSASTPNLQPIGSSGKKTPASEPVSGTRSRRATVEFQEDFEATASTLPQGATGSAAPRAFRSSLKQRTEDPDERPKRRGGSLARSCVNEDMHSKNRASVIAGFRGSVPRSASGGSRPGSPTMNSRAARKQRRSTMVSSQKPPPVDHNKIGRVFWQLEHQNEVAEELIVKALEMLGFRRVEEHTDWIHDIMDSYFDSARGLGRKELHLFAEQYSVKNWNLLNAIYAELPRGATGLLEQEGLEVFLQRRGITPLPWVLKELLSEFVADPCLRGLNLREFALLDVTLEDRCGFTEQEAQTLKEVFQRHDPVSTGEIPLSTLRAAIAYIGYPRNRVVETRIAEATVEDGFCVEMLTQNDFFKLIRLVRETFVDVLRHELLKRGDGEVVRIQDMPQILWHLGYHTAAPRTCHQAAAALNFAEARQVTLVQIYCVAERLQSTRGLSDKEMEEAPEAFRKFGLMRKGLMCVLEARLALWWLGYPLTTHAVRKLIVEFDEDLDDCIDIREFIRCIGRCHDIEVERIRKLFSDSSIDPLQALSSDDEDDYNEDEESERTSVSQVECASLPRRVLLDSGHEACEEMDRFLADEIGKHGESDWSSWELVEMASEYRLHSKERLRRQHLFSNFEVENLFGAFRKHDPAELGYLDGERLADLISSLYPSSTTNPQVHAQARELLRGADSNTDAKLEFDEFLWLMRQTYDKLARDEYWRELQVIREASFARDEVNEYRALFRKSCLGELLPRVPSDAVSDLVMDVCTERGQESRLYQLLHDLGQNDDGGAFDFPDFLFLMSKLETGIPAASQMPGEPRRKKSTLPSLPTALQPHVWYCSEEW
mmetsp:Transcript_30537/g.67267  ORF Transcript_30537/g.67267 Transcript_30537/m.67267 type:complete len:1296 (+) Transcript_30537:65-3952(+)